MSELTTHNGTVKSDETMAQGYVSYSCEAWGAPDNTGGQIGWHVVYHPLSEGYRGHEHLTDEMRKATREHYAIRDEARRVATAEADAKKMAAPQRAAPRASTEPCPLCGSYCCGDCQAHGKNGRTEP